MPQTITNTASLTDHPVAGGQDTQPPITAVALYAVAEIPGTEDDILAALHSYASRRGWYVPDGCAVIDTGRLHQRDEELRPGLAQIRAAVSFERVSGLVVPSFAHVGYHWSDWTAERTWLLRHGQFIVALDPGMDPVS